MSYDSSRFRGNAMYSDEPGYRSDTGVRDSSGFRDNADSEDTTARNGTFGTGSYPVSGDSVTGVSSAEPGETEEATPTAAPVRDRLAVHFGWELLLVLAFGAVAFLLRRADSGALSGSRLDAIYLYAAILGFVAVGTALSLRAAVPNLAMGPLAYAAALFFADNSDRGLLPTAGVTALLAIAVGVAIAVLVTAFHVPAWAASMAAGFGLIVWIEQHHETAKMVDGAYQPSEHPLVWFVAFAVISVSAGITGLIPKVRRTVGQYRPVTDPALRGGGAGAGVAALALIGSSLLAALSGVLIALNNREVSPAENGVALTGLALGAALLGGTSVFGRRGGLFGTVLAVVGITLVFHYADAEGWILNDLGVAAGAIAVGLAASRLIELLGSRRASQDDWSPVGDWNSVNSTEAARNTDSTTHTSADSWEDRWGASR